jgi:hypothetical protein
VTRLAFLAGRRLRAFLASFDQVDELLLFEHGHAEFGGFLQFRARFRAGDDLVGFL